MAKKTKKSADPQPAAAPELTPETEITDPIGDLTDGEAAAAPEPMVETATDPEPATEETEDSEPELQPRPPAKLERLQKILAQAGVASRRKAEEMIELGRVQINGKIVTTLGTKADAGRDHIRVDGKLLQGSERLRYFVLNKPRGFVTTVKDPEGRPTVMQFFAKINERLYPVGRLDYLSEGLLVVTNDGELANRLTRAAAGVEKTYLVKVAGQPTEAELDLLRGGVSIERGKPGSPQVRTSPARIRQVRQGDNPWYEVVLIEGRNRELRKMFEEVGHFVEKIRRVGYGPLVLDQEPGNLRELEPEELTALRAAAEGKLRTPKSKELRRRNAMDAAGLPTVTPKPTVHPRPPKTYVPKSFDDRPAAGPKDYRPKRSDRPSRPSTREYGAPRPAWKKDDRPRPYAGKPQEGRPPANRTFDKPAAEQSYAARPGTGRPPANRTFDKPAAERGYAARPGTGRPAANRSFDKPAAERSYGARPGTGRPSTGRPAAARSFGAKPFGDKPSAGRSFPAKTAWKKPDFKERPSYNRPPAAPRRDADDFVNPGPRQPSRLRIEPIEEMDRPSSSRPSADRPRPSRPFPDSGRSSSARPRPSRPFSDSGRSGSGRPFPNRTDSGRSSSERPFRREGNLARPFTTSSGKPRAGGARPSSKPRGPADRSSSSGWKPGKPASGRSYGARPDRPSKPYSNSEPRGDGKAAPGWKPKTRYGGSGKPASGGSSRPGGFSKPAYKGKSSAPRRPGAPGGKKRR